jgi:hypothetical protein
MEQAPWAKVWVLDEEWVLVVPVQVWDKVVVVDMVLVAGDLFLQKMNYPR